MACFSFLISCIYTQCAGKGSNHPPKESVLVPPRDEAFEVDCVDNTNPHTTMPFGEYQPGFLPPIHGEFTRLLCEIHEECKTLPAARQLDFGEGASTSSFQQ